MKSIYCFCGKHFHMYCWLCCFCWILSSLWVHLCEIEQQKILLFALFTLKSHSIQQTGSWTSHHYIIQIKISSDFIIYMCICLNIYVLNLQDGKSMEGTKPFFNTLWKLIWPRVLPDLSRSYKGICQRNKSLALVAPQIRKKRSHCTKNIQTLGRFFICQK